MATVTKININKVANLLFIINSMWTSLKTLLFELSEPQVYVDIAIKLCVNKI